MMISLKQCVQFFLHIMKKIEIILSQSDLDVSFFSDLRLFFVFFVSFQNGIFRPGLCQGVQ
jgi:hypothetical protein